MGEEVLALVRDMGMANKQTNWNLFLSTTSGAAQQCSRCVTQLSSMGICPLGHIKGRNVPDDGFLMSLGTSLLRV